MRVNKKPSLSHLQLNGKTDDAQLGAIIAYLRDTKKIPITQIKKDYFILISKWDYAVSGPYRYLTKQQTEGNIIHRPDIIIQIHPHKTTAISVIIELDGSFHNSGPGGPKKTRLRNEHYTEAKIPFIVINILDLRFLKKNWFEFLDEELEKLALPIT